MLPRTLALAGLLLTATLALTAVPALDAVSPVGDAQALCTPRGTACTDWNCDLNTLQIPPAWCEGSIDIT